MGKTKNATFERCSPAVVACEGSTTVDLDSSGSASCDMGMSAGKHQPFFAIFRFVKKVVLRIILMVLCRCPYLRLDASGCLAKKKLLG